MNNKNLVFAGCSLTSGSGWDGEDGLTAYDNLWVHLCHRGIDRFKNLNLVNIAVGGASNTDIFEQVVSYLSTNSSNIECVLCQWTSGPRYNWNIGFELWNTTEFITKIDVQSHNIILSDGTQYPRKYINDLKSRFRTMHHLHWEILKVVKYSKILEILAAKMGTKIFFINGVCPWDENYFTRLENVLPKDYTEFTKKNIIDVDSHSNEDNQKLYNLAHYHYSQAGGINYDLWINLYGSFYENQIDFNSDGMHAGIKSNQNYYSIVKNRLEELNYI